jgi:beta-glucosidase
MVDIARDQRWGRVVEGSGEDPYLGAAMAAARVRGFQGTDLGDDSTLLATAKHFVAYGAAEGGRDYNTADISQRTLYETYLPPFEAAVRAGVQSAGFNEIAGVPMHANRDLLRGVLRNAWGFEGVLVSDYTGVLELQRHGVAADSAAAGVIALEAGVDVDMVSSIYLNHVARLVRGGVTRESLVDQAARRVLRAKYLLGLFADPYRYSDPAREQTRIFTTEHLAAARAMARKSIVLLKNSGPCFRCPKRSAASRSSARSRSTPPPRWARGRRPARRANREPWRSSSTRATCHSMGRISGASSSRARSRCSWGPAPSPFVRRISSWPTERLAKAAPVDTRT